MAPKLCVWRRLGVRHKRLGDVKGVGRRASPQRLKNIGSYCNATNCSTKKIKGFLLWGKQRLQFGDSVYLTDSTRWDHKFFAVKFAGFVNQYPTCGH